MCFQSLKKKNGGRAQKNNDRRRTSAWNKKLVICVFAVKHTLSDACDTMWMREIM